MRRTRTRTALTAGIAALLIVGLAVGLGVFNRSPATGPVPLPDDAEVESMTAEVFGVEGVDPVPEFSVPAEYVPSVLQALRPAGADASPPRRQENTLGRLTVRVKDGRTLTITFPWIGKEPLTFTLNGVRCVRRGRFEPVHVGERESDQSWTSECCALAYALQEIDRERAIGGRRPGRNKWLEELERSAGMRPPRRQPLE